jgi:hypothetical protein
MASVADANTSGNNVNEVKSFVGIARPFVAEPQVECVPATKNLVVRAKSKRWAALVYQGKDSLTVEIISVDREGDISRMVITNIANIDALSTIQQLDREISE